MSVVNKLRKLGWEPDGESVCGTDGTWYSAINRWKRGEDIIILGNGLINKYKPKECVKNHNFKLIEEADFKLTLLERFLFKRQLRSIEKMWRKVEVINYIQS